MHIDLNDKYCSAIRGRQFWLELKRKYNYDNEKSCLIIFPCDDVELNNCAMDKMNDFIHRRFYSDVIVLHSDNIVVDSIAPEDYNLYFEDAKQGDILDVLQYYRLVQFTKNIVVISMDTPYGSRGLIGNAGIVLADYVENVVFM